MLPALALFVVGCIAQAGRSKGGVDSQAKRNYKERMKINAKTIHHHVDNDVRDALAFISENHSALSLTVIGLMLLAALSFNICASLPLFTWATEGGGSLTRRADKPKASSHGININLGQNERGRSGFYFFAFTGLPDGLDGIWSYGTLFGLGLLQLFAVWFTCAGRATRIA